MPLNYILRECIGGHKFTKSKENLLMYIDDSKLFAKNGKKLETLIQTKNIQPGYRNEILLKKMCHARNEKWKKTNNGRNRSTKLGKNENTRRKGNLLGVIG